MFVSRNPGAVTTLHSTFCSLTNTKEPYLLGYTDYAWGKWKLTGKQFTGDGREWNESDLVLVVSMLKRVWKDKPYTLACFLKFRKLIVDADVPGSCFSENWQTAQALSRARSKTPRRDAVLAATHRPTDLTPEPVHVSVVMERAKLAGMLKQWREAL